MRARARISVSRKKRLKLWSKSPDKLKDISDALKENKEAADKLRPAYEKVSKGLKGVFEAGSDTKKAATGN